MSKFAPLENRDTLPFWQACREGRLSLQRCTACQTFRHPPSPICHACHHTDHEWVNVPGRGRVWTYAIMHEPLDGWPGELPLVVAMVELDEGVKLVTNVSVDPESVHVGMEVEVFFESGPEGVVLPKFRPLAA